MAELMWVGGVLGCRCGAPPESTECAPDPGDPRSLHFRCHACGDAGVLTLSIDELMVLGAFMRLDEKLGLGWATRGFGEGTK
jgi:hypothetical protein